MTRFGTRLDARTLLMAGLAASLIAALAAGSAVPVAAASKPLPTAVVETTGGAIQGLVDEGVSTFKGIPYGAAPVGERRFLPPQPAAPWDAVLLATDFGAPAMQLYDRPHTGETLSFEIATIFTMRSEMKTDNEDSLFLNVWTPAADDAKRPVMVWLHGGGYAYGSGSWPVYDGTSLARHGDVVVVTVNHRLNVFGYLHLADMLGGDYARSGNAGMLDIVLALEWLRDNVARFGGDPGNVTIMGESGGGSKVSHLMAMPSAEGLFHKAIVQSGPGLTGVPAEVAAGVARAVVEALGGDPNDRAEARRTLLAAPAQALLDAYRNARAAAGDERDLPLAPVVDGDVLPRHPFTPDAPARSADVPLLIGWNKDEMTIFNTAAPWFGTLTEAALESRVTELAGDAAEPLLEAYRELHPDYSPTYLYNAIVGDRWAFRGSVTLAERKAALARAPVYMYYLTWDTPVGNGVFKSPHTLDIPFMFRNVDEAVVLTGDSPAARRLESLMSDAWIAFARTGDPGTEALPPWPPYDANRRATMIFDVEPRVVDDPKRAARELLPAEAP